MVAPLYRQAGEKLPTGKFAVLGYNRSTMPQKSAHIDKLLVQLNDLPHRNKEALDALYKRSAMIIRNVFGDKSHYLDELSDIDFYPAVVPSENIARDMRWKSGTAELRNLYQTMLEELETFGDGQLEAARPVSPQAGPPEEYDLAFSFASEDREYVESIKAACDTLGLTTYYDKDRKINQWGKSFIGEQRKVYSGYKTKHFVPFISKHYFTKPIPTDEFKSALMESTRRNQYILPIKLDNSEVSVEYLHRDTQYLKKDDYTPEQLAGALKYIVTSDNAPAKDVDQLLTDELNLPTPKIIPRAYSKFEEAEALIAYTAEKFDKHLQKLRNEGYAPVVRKKDDAVRVLIERDGKTIFTLNVFFSAMGDNHVGFNFVERSMMANAQSENGNIEPVFDREQQKAGYILTNYMNPGDKVMLSKGEIMEFFWGKMNNTLEAQS